MRGEEKEKKITRGRREKITAVVSSRERVSLVALAFVPWFLRKRKALQTLRTAAGRNGSPGKKHPQGEQESAALGARRGAAVHTAHSRVLPAF